MPLPLGAGKGELIFIVIAIVVTLIGKVVEKYKAEMKKRPRPGDRRADVARDVVNSERNPFARSRRDQEAELEAGTARSPAFEAPEPAFEAPEPAFEAPEPAFEAPEPAYFPRKPPSAPLPVKRKKKPAAPAARRPRASVALVALRQSGIKTPPARIVRFLGGRESLRKALLVREVLDPPRALMGLFDTKPLYDLPVGDYSGGEPPSSGGPHA